MKFNKKAFTLIELLVVIAIIGILATISIVSLSNARAKSRDAKRAGDMKQVQTALELFFNDKGRYPSASEWDANQIFSTSTGATSTYMQIIPSAPIPADGRCTSDQNSISYIPTSDGASYSISFCLGGNTGTLASDPKCLTPGGIIDVECNIDGGQPADVCGGISSVSYGGDSYPTVAIGTQCWFAKNLNVGTRVDDPDDQGDYSGGIQKYCYDDSEAICDTDGGLYQWHMALGLPQACDASEASPCNISGTIQGIYPSGWHIPSFNELQTLAQNDDPGCDLSANNCHTAGGKLKASSISTPVTWDGTNNYNFSVFPAGYNLEGSLDGRGTLAVLWSASPPSGYPGIAWSGLLLSGGTTFYGNSDDRATGFSVRCLQD